jgi:hypothetical protein
MTGFVRETLTMPVDAARQPARSYLTEFQTDVYMTAVERYRPVEDDHSAAASDG